MPDSQSVVNPTSSQINSGVDTTVSQSMSGFVANSTETLGSTINSQSDVSDQNGLNIDELEKQNAEYVLGNSVATNNQLGSVTLSDGTVVNVEEYLYSILHLMIKYNSSDVYFTFGEEPALRIYGEVCRLKNLPKLDDPVLDGMAKVMMSDDDRKEFADHLSADLGYTAHGRRYRVNISLQRNHVMIVARLLDEKVPTIDERGLPQIFKTLIKKTSGIVFVVGPTGSGKSTTLAAMVEEVNMTRASHVITIEDPIEYVFQPKKSLFEQKELGKDIIDFASAMKYALRQRPDVILFGETRDPESLRNALALSETGHLVLTTIHSRSSEQTINKIISMFPVDEQATVKNQLGENMAAIIVQKLLKRADGKGMIPAHEILLNNTAVENIIRENKLNQIKNAIYSNRNMGMMMLEDDLARLVVNGLVTVDEAMFFANDKDSLRRILEGACQ